MIFTHWPMQLATVIMFLLLVSGIVALGIVIYKRVWADKTILVLLIPMAACSVAALMIIEMAFYGLSR